MMMMMMMIIIIIIIITGHGAVRNLLDVGQAVGLWIVKNLKQEKVRSRSRFDTPCSHVVGPRIFEALKHAPTHSRKIWFYVILHVLYMILYCFLSDLILFLYDLILF